jgi:hypothetical protein
VKPGAPSAAQFHKTLKEKPQLVVPRFHVRSTRAARLMFQAYGRFYVVVYLLLLSLDDSSSVFTGFTAVNGPLR